MPPINQRKEKTTKSSNECLTSITQSLNHNLRSKTKGRKEKICTTYLNRVLTIRSHNLGLRNKCKILKKESQNHLLITNPNSPMSNSLMVLTLAK